MLSGSNHATCFGLTTSLELCKQSNTSQYSENQRHFTKGQALGYDALVKSTAGEIQKTTQQGGFLWAHSIKMQLAFLQKIYRFKM